MGSNPSTSTKPICYHPSWCWKDKCSNCGEPKPPPAPYIPFKQPVELCLHLGQRGTGFACDRVVTFCCNCAMVLEDDTAAS